MTGRTSARSLGWGPEQEGQPHGAEAGPGNLWEEGVQVRDTRAPQATEVQAEASPAGTAQQSVCLPTSWEREMCLQQPQLKDTDIEGHCWMWPRNSLFSGTLSMSLVGSL